MHSLLAWRDGAPSAKGFDVFKTASDIVLDGAAAFSGRGAGQQGPMVPRDGRTVTLPGGKSIWGIIRFDAECGYCRIRQTSPVGSGFDVNMVVDVELGRMGDDVRMTVRSSWEPDGSGIVPFPPYPGPPPVVLSVTGAIPCLSMKWPFSGRAFQVGRMEAAGLADVIMDRGRGFPVVVFSRKAFSGCLTADADDAAAALSGIALVVDLEDKDATFALNRLVGRELGAYNGAVRTCWAYGDGGRTNLSMAPAIEHDPARFIRTLSGEMAACAAARVVRPYLMDCAMESLGIAGKGPEPSPGTSPDSTARDEDSRLAEENAKLRRRIRELSKKEEKCQRDLSETRRFKDMGEAVRQAAKDFPALVFLDSAFDSADQSPFANPDKAYALFQALAEVGATWRKRKGVLNTSWFEAMKKKGVQVREGVSDVTAARWGSEYEFQYEGENIRFTSHATIGVSHDPKKTISVYWYLDREKLSVVVGHAGRHPNNTKT